MVVGCVVVADGLAQSSVSSLLDSVHHLRWAHPGENCFLDTQCSWNKNVICTSNGLCECQFGSWNGEKCMPAIHHDPIDQADQYQGGGNENIVETGLENSFCLPSQIEKNGKCYIRRKPGEACTQDFECMNVGDIEYYCIANVCQEPPECPPGFVAMGAECLPYSVTGGPCIHPSQCLPGSVCIKGKCRGPCDFNQLFLEESCVDYEGAGCIAMSCINSRCPRAFPTCNYIAQKKDYLCCDRSMETKVSCPLPNSEPQIDKATGSVVECMHRPCMANYRCVFASYGRGKYICCSKPGKRREGDLLTSEPDEYDENFGQQSTTRAPWIPPPPAVLPNANQPPWTPQPIVETARWTTPWPPQTNNGWNSYGANNNYGGNWNNQWNNGVQQQGWIAGNANQQPWGTNTWNNNYNGWNGNQGWGAQQWNYNNGYNNLNGGQIAPQRRRRIRPQFQGGTRSSLNRRPNGWTNLQTWPPIKQRSRKRQKGTSMIRSFHRSDGSFRHPGYLNESVNVEPTVSTLIPPMTSTLTSTANTTLKAPIAEINSTWPHAIRVLVLYCCTNRQCIYRDQLEEFCHRVLDPHIHSYHVTKNLQHQAAVSDYDEWPSNSTLPADESTAISAFPIRPD
ncbi:hypothetical protein M3Y98_01083600 [Aphelenchoides besseyi]|nr:hypothetical protein M3Y98_01083600 [Aphelenchoides besseyi]KAI6209482.1 hypothetical protein M3Y96_00226000 [Aphelenchoides besseyi]